MSKNLMEARKLAERIRFSGDKIHVNEKFKTHDNSAFEESFYTTDLPINSEITPSLFQAFSDTCERLKIPSQAVKAFVFASPEIQAQCISVNENSCIIRISSALVDLLEIDELSFVIGHEMGHFLYRHGIINLNIGEESHEYFMLQRSQEVSVDRIGYLATDSIDVAIKALMKSVSGLKSKYLRFDISNYLSHLKVPSKNSFGKFSGHTHPSILFRCRSLLWFSMKVSNLQDIESINQKSIKKLNMRVMADLKKYIDGPAHNIITEAKKKFAMWTFMNEVIQDKTFDESEQKLFVNKFGQSKLEKMTSLLKGKTFSEIERIIDRKLQKSKRELEKIIPISCEQEIDKINNEFKNI